MFVLSVPDSSWHDQVTNDLDQLIQLNLSVPIIVLTASVDPANVVKALKSGAKGYIPANMPLDIALAAIRFVSAGGTFVPAAVMLEDNSARDHVTTPSTSSTMFTERQAAVMEGLRKGKANKMIAYELNMCESTVKVHVRKIMRKLKATNRTEVAYLANELFNR
jgi:DNA-binding NarL/FixJ family response regulator